MIPGMRNLIISFVLVLAVPIALNAQTVSAVSGAYTVRDFIFANGEQLPELRLHYRTLGTAQRNTEGHVTNAVLIMHGTMGSGDNFLSRTFGDLLFGPGQLLDATKYFTILPDAIGHGESSKPSDGLRARFPRYGYRDIVRAQHLLVTDHLKVDHLRLIMGTSMGGMQTWMWGTMYPDMTDALLPLASVPTQIAGRNRMMRKMVSDMIRLDPSWQNGNYTSQPFGLRGALHILSWMQSSPLYWQSLAPTRDAADAWFEERVAARLKTTDANDMLYQFEASADYDPSPDLEKIRAAVLAINSADDQVNPPELELMEKLIPRVKRGRYVLLPITSETRGHGTHSLPAIWGSYLAELLKESEPTTGTR
jgi:homoserine O-acetyltransferase